MQQDTELEKLTSQSIKTQSFKFETICAISKNTRRNILSSTKLFKLHKM